MIDLHTHSTASDGSFSPSSLMEEAAKRSLSVIALTDHDTAAGLQEAEKAALALGIRFIPGIELEIVWNSGADFHLLGLGLRQLSPGFTAAVEEIARRREDRNLEIVEKMNKAGIAVSYDEIRAFSDCNYDPNAPKSSRHSIGRPHFASFLVMRKIVKNREQAFSHYLSRGKPFFTPRIGMEFEKAVEIIRESGGITVLAHPMSLYIGWDRLPDLLKSLKDKGLDGIEAWHPAATVSSCSRLEELGKKLKLLITAGSDFHGETRSDRKLGFTAGGRKIDESFLEGIL